MITLVGLGPGDESSLSLGALSALETASLQHVRGDGHLFLRTEHHPVVEALKRRGIRYDSFDILYDDAPDFDSVYAEICTRVLHASSRTDDGSVADVTYAVPGHPLCGEDSVQRIREGAEAAGIETRTVSSGSFVEAALTAVGASLGDGLSIRDALTLRATDSIDRQGNRVDARPDPAHGLLLYQIFDAASASQAKLALMRDYPDDWPIALVRWAGVAGREEVRRIPLFRLDR